MRSVKNGALPRAQRRYRRCVHGSILRDHIKHRLQDIMRACIPVAIRSFSHLFDHSITAWCKYNQCFHKKTVTICQLVPYIAVISTPN